MSQESFIQQEIRLFDKLMDNMAVVLLMVTATGLGTATICTFLPLALSEWK